MAAENPVVLSCAPAKGPKMRGIQLIRAFLSNESGATAIEYGLIAAGIALAIIAAVNTLGTTMSNKFTSINSSLK
jgi:pilus assembly protein Flp/PilA